ncbi:hypothetical protein E2C01_025941 [Portunus trituberculatus]|uniref:Uncharacterized protein n=1 Tax=Portunus trituberculatus TaxID=210409 RepID=A0A5B7EEA4_PORTR|nr:hypothetical protein [Portunus trituberculatus]
MDGTLGRHQRKQEEDQLDLKGSVVLSSGREGKGRAGGKGRRRRGSRRGYRLAFPSALASPASNPAMVVWRRLADEEEEEEEEEISNDDG